MYKKSVILLISFVVILSLGALSFIGHGVKDRKKVTEKIAVIYVDGVIMGGRGQGTLFGESGGTDQIIKQLHEAGKDSSVKVILLRINSPGGSAPASQEVGEELKKIRSAGKPIVTSMGDMAASGGYWLPACTDKIYANPATLTGSIGVYMPYANWEELYKKIGIYQEKIKSGPHKDILSPERMITNEERAIIQTMVDDMYNQFVTVVSEGRRMEPDKVRQLADGRIYTGNQAKQLGLVDELGNMYDAIEGAKAIAGLQGDVELKEYGKQSPLQMLLGSQEDAKILLEKILFNQFKNAGPITAPLAMPEKWQVE